MKWKQCYIYVLVGLLLPVVGVSIRGEGVFLVLAGPYVLLFFVVLGLKESAWLSGFLHKILFTLVVISTITLLMALSNTSKNWDLSGLFTGAIFVTVGVFLNLLSVVFFIYMLLGRIVR